MEIHELSEQGEYVPVEVVQRPEVLTGGVYQLRQVPRGNPDLSWGHRKMGHVAAVIFSIINLCIFFLQNSDHSGDV